MRKPLRRVVAALAAFAVASTLAPLALAPAASAAPPGTLPNGSLTMSPSSGHSGTNFSLLPDEPRVCPGDSATGGYRWNTYMTPTSVDPATLTYGVNGPNAQAGEFTVPLFDTAGTPVVNRHPDIGDARISGIPMMNFAVFGPDVVPAGTYWVGIACTKDGVTETFWSLPITITTAPTGGGPSEITYRVGTPCPKPTITSVAVDRDTGDLVVNFTPPAAVPAATSFTATATPTTGTGGPVTATLAAAPVRFAYPSALQYGQTYSVTLTCTNANGTSPASDAVSALYQWQWRPVGNLQATPGEPGSGQLDLTWTAPATGPAPTGYLLSVSPAGGTVTQEGTAATVSGLECGRLYTVTVTPEHQEHPAEGAEVEVRATPLCGQVLLQQITVARPPGALVLTQVCGRHGALPAEPASPGFGVLGPLPAGGAGSAPRLGGPDGPPDPKFPEYPNPAEPNYPTSCGIDLGTAQYVSAGEGRGQFFAAWGRLNQVTVVDTRDTDPGWGVAGSVSDFDAGPGKSFSGAQLGWTPVLSATSRSFTDADGTTYSQQAAAGPRVLPHSSVAPSDGLSTPRTLGSAPARATTEGVVTGGLGTAVLDAWLKLLIPVTVPAGNYTATLTISAV
jgi:hypothetical protein